MPWLDNIRRVTPYVPGEQPQGAVIKLNTNECPYPPSPKVGEALASMSADNLRKYPDPTSETLCAALADYYGLNPEQIFVGTGSDDCLAQCFLTFFAGNKPILFPDVTYSFYKVWAEVYRIPYETIPLNDDFTVDPKAYGRENGGIILANPNAPTGLAADLNVIEAIVAENPNSVVIVDEAYIDFGGETALSLLPSYENLVIVRTMSKSRALAGMRIGYVMASPTLIKYLNDVKFSVNSYTMNMPSLLAGVAAIKDDAYFRQTVARIIATRERTKDELKKLNFGFPDSTTNFIFATHPTINAAELFDYLREREIYVRYFSTPRLKDYLRITIGTDREMDTLLKTLAERIR